MRKTLYPILAVMLIAAIVIGIAYYTPIQNPAATSPGIIRVIVTIPPQAEFVERIGGEKVAVTILVPPGANPHTYEPTPSQMEKVSQADMYAKVGSPIEFELTWMNKIIKTNPDMLIVDCSQGIHLIEARVDHEENENHFRKDPHIWLSPRNAMIMVENIFRGLVQLDPDDEEYYAQNRDVYIKELKDLDNRLARTFSNLSKNEFIVYHPVWGYLARDYGLKQISIEKDGKEPTPGRLATLIDQARKHDIKMIFASPEFETRTAETVAKEIDGRVVLISPLSKDYVDNLSRISEEIANSLS